MVLVGATIVGSMATVASAGEPAAHRCAAAVDYAKGQGESAKEEMGAFLLGLHRGDALPQGNMRFNPQWSPTPHPAG